MDLDIRFANICDASLIHHLMIRAFSEYKNEIPPSSALDETVQSITAALNEGEQSVIGFIDNIPVGMVRFRLKAEGLYFYRLSVIPEKQGEGIAKRILTFLEEYAKQKECQIIFCKVRMNVLRNIYLYQSLGYQITGEEIVHRPNNIKFKVVTMKKEL